MDTLSLLSGSLQRLARSRPLFHSEADFQHSLAFAMREASPPLSIRLEVPIGKKRSELDIVVRDKVSGVRIGIELKYSKSELSFLHENEEYRLPGTATSDVYFHSFWTDVWRLEQFVLSRDVDRGIAVMLSNRPECWEPKRQSRPTTYDAFRTHEGASCRGLLDWSSRTSTKTRRDCPPVPLSGEYTCYWTDYSMIPDAKFGTFRYLLVEVPSQTI